MAGCVTPCIELLLGNGKLCNVPVLHSDEPNYVSALQFLVGLGTLWVTVHGKPSPKPFLVLDKLFYFVCVTSRFETDNDIIINSLK